MRRTWKQPKLFIPGCWVWRFIRVFLAAMFSFILDRGCFWFSTRTRPSGRILRTAAGEGVMGRGPCPGKSWMGGASGSKRGGGLSNIFSGLEEADPSLSRTPPGIVLNYQFLRLGDFAINA